MDAGDFQRIKFEYIRKSIKLYRAEIRALNSLSATFLPGAYNASQIRPMLVI